MVLTEKRLPVMPPVVIPWILRYRPLLKRNRRHRQENDQRYPTRNHGFIIPQKIPLASETNPWDIVLGSAAAGCTAERVGGAAF